MDKLPECEKGRSYTIERSQITRIFAGLPKPGEPFTAKPSMGLYDFLL